MKAADVIAYLQNYKKTITIMEVCGSHTSAIIKSGIRSIISPSIRLVSGPGCPVCVTPPSYIDKLVSCAADKSCTVVSFGDMFKVRGTSFSMEEAKAAGANVEMVYSPLQVIEMAKQSPQKIFLVAAVGFETTAPVFAVLTEQIIRAGLANIKLLTALKTMPPVLEYICENEAVDAFLCPGHVSTIIGTAPYEKLCEKYKKPCVIAGFEPEHILAAIYEAVTQHEKKQYMVKNLYKSAVKGLSQAKATALMEKYFTAAPAYWRGIGEIAGSGLYIKDEYSYLDAGSYIKGEDDFSAGCRCRDVILGRIYPDECPLFGQKCRPDNAIGACMVSQEGACGNWYNSKAT